MPKIELNALNCSKKLNIFNKDAKLVANCLEKLTGIQSSNQLTGIVETVLWGVVGRDPAME